MRLNIFRIPVSEVNGLKKRLADAKMKVIQNVDQGAWRGAFYFSEEPAPTPIPWVKTFSTYFDQGKLPMNRSHFAVFLFELVAKDKTTDCFALSFGKSHFYIRPYCDYDFGIELAKRIANEDDIRQTSGKRFAGRRTRDIKTYAANTPLIVESGESVDYIQASIVPTREETYGKTGKFGTSAQLAPDIAPDDIGDFLSTVIKELEEGPRFPLPRTTVISEKEEIARFDELLLAELQTEVGTSDFTNNSIDLYGVDFVFPSDGTFVLRCGRSFKRELERLTMGDLKQYIAENQIPRDSILKIKITHVVEDEPSYVKEIKESVDFIADGDLVVLTGGKWLRFNQDYLDFLDSAVREIEIEAVEDEFNKIRGKEGDFNASQAVADAGFDVADKDFELFKTRAKTPIEAWDLRRGDTVYAVKFGSAQKLHYVCDQALNVLELLRNKAEVKEIEDFDRYCLWFGYRVQNMPKSLAESGSIILKQKVEAWARKTTELGVTPVIRLSQHVRDDLKDDQPPA